MRLFDKSTTSNVAAEREIYILVTEHLHTSIVLYLARSEYMADEFPAVYVCIRTGVLHKPCTSRVKV